VASIGVSPVTDDNGRTRVDARTSYALPQQQSGETHQREGDTTGPGGDMINGGHSAVWLRLEADIQGVKEEVARLKQNPQFIR